ncbi:DEAD/DEAH box helicase [Patescibacteria group bacterium]|nr:DEAD/DEAH box helicase [Patescibacteria group bacterium]
MSNTQFDSMGLSPEILHGLNDLGFESPTPIQSQAIPFILSGENDLIGLAQTGTGKTAAFGLPILSKIDPSQKNVQAIVLCPTRELCMQITKDIGAFSKYLPHIKAAAIYGGSSMYLQVRKLQEGAQIVVGTPGRVKDLISRGKLKINEIKWLILDEADDMLDKGFKEDLDEILETTPEEKQTLLFSATMSPWISKVAQKQMKNPREIRVAAQNQGADTVEHKFVTVHARDRYAALRRLLDVNPDVYGIVFCRTRRETKDIAAKLIADNYSAQAIHGDISQDERSEAMARFRDKHIQILVATDVAARGIDVNDLTHVINFDLPDSPELYVHRSGRTGRAGKTGVSLTVINMKERGKLRRIESLMRQKFEEIHVPTGKEICEAQLMNLVHTVKTTEVDLEKLAPYLPAIYEELSGLSVEELVQHFVSVEFNRFLSHYSRVSDISTQRSYGDERGGRERGRERGRGRDFSREKKNIKLKRYKLNVGKKDGFGPKGLFGLVNGNQNLRGIEIGGIQVDADFTVFEADSRYHDKIIRSMGNGKYQSKRVKVEAV